MFSPCQNWNKSDSQTSPKKIITVETKFTFSTIRTVFLTEIDCPIPSANMPYEMIIQYSCPIAVVFS